MNRHTSPQLDALVAELRADRDLKVEAQKLKHMFAANAETLVHGDLHSGSIMVTDERDPHHRSGVRLLRADGLRRRHAARQFLDGLLLAVRPREGWRPRRRCAPICSASSSRPGPSSAPSSRISGEPSAPACSTTAACSRIAAIRSAPSRRSTACCTTSGSTCWALPASRSTAASSASPTMPISRPSPTRICALHVRRRR